MAPIAIAMQEYGTDDEEFGPSPVPYPTDLPRRVAVILGLKKAGNGRRDRLARV